MKRDKDRNGGREADKEVGREVKQKSKNTWYKNNQGKPLWRGKGWSKHQKLQKYQEK